MILAFAALQNLKVHQINVKRAFLNKDLIEEIYIKQLEGSSTLRQKKKVYKLINSLYDLKQALR